MKAIEKISKKYYVKEAVIYLLVYLLVFGLPIRVAVAKPSNPDVVKGVAGVTQTGNNTTVTMNSKKAVINWDGLNTSSNEVLQFVKASGHFTVLNRVTKGGATQFDGSLFGNQGHIIIVNQKGIVFGTTAIVDAYKFTASALDISNTDFMNGIYKFAGGDGPVANYGKISAEQVALIGKQVLNAGLISSPGGYVLMAAGDRVLLGQEGSNIVVEVASVTVPEGAASEGLGDVINEGTVEAAGGKIVLAAGDTFSRAIEGLDTLALSVSGGTGRVGQFGTLNADSANGDGGSITLTAANVVALGENSVTTANAGANGKGGEVIVYSPDTALFRDGAMVQAKGGSESGNGGFFELSGKDYVEVEGQIDLTAANGGAGTFLIDPRNITIDDSGNNNGTIPGSGSTRTWSPTGTNAKLDVDTLEGYLGNSNVIVSTAGSGGDSGWIKLNAGKDLDYSGSHDLTLRADDFIWINSGIDFGGSGDVTLLAGTYIDVDATGTSGGIYGIDLDSGKLTMDSGSGQPIYLADDIRAGNIEFKDNVILDGSGGNQDQDIVATNTDILAYGSIDKSNSGNVKLDADEDIITNAAITTNGGNATLNAGDDIRVNAGSGITINGNGNVTLDADDEIEFKSGSTGITLNGNGNALLDAGDWITLNSGITLNGSGSATLNADGDITTNAPITLTGNGNITLKADDNITINAAVETTGGDMKLFADYDHSIGGDMHSADGVSIIAGGNIDIKGNDIRLGGAVSSTGGNLTITGRDCDPKPDWGNVWAKSTLDAGGNIDISVTGEYNHHYYPGTITLDGDVTAVGGNLSLYNDTYTGNGVTLKAGNDIRLKHSANPLENCTKLTGDHALTLIAGNQIVAPATTIGVWGSSLTLEQWLPLDTASFIFANQGNTDLTLISDNGSVTSDMTKWQNAADEWHSIGAKADEDITLKGNETITLTELEAMHGDIEVVTSQDDVVGTEDITAHQGKVSITAEDDVMLGSSGSPIAVLAGDDLTLKAGGDKYDDVVVYGTLTTKPDSDGDVKVEAGDDIKLYDDVVSDGDITLVADKANYDGVVDAEALTAVGTIDISASDDTINLHDDVTAGVDILLNNTTVADDGVKLDAGQDVTLADGKTLTGQGDLDVEADRNITLGGEVETQGYMHLNADADGINGGDVLAKSSLETVGDYMLITGDNIEVQGTATSGLTMGMYATGNITLDDAAVANGDMTLDADGDVTTKSLTTTGSDMLITGQNIDIGGPVDSAGNIEMDADGYQGIALHDWVEAEGNIKMTAVTGDDWGSLVADNTITSNGGEIDIFTDYYILLHGAVKAQTDLTLRADEIYYHDSYITADSTLTAVTGNLEVGARQNINLKDVANAGNDMTLDADIDGDGTGNLDVHGLVAGGNINLSAGDSTINIHKSADISADADVDAVGDVVLHNNTIADEGVKIKSQESDVVLDADKTLTGLGDLTVEAGDDILLGVYCQHHPWYGGSAGDVTTVGDLILDAGDDVYAYGNLVSNEGDIEIYSSNWTTNLYGDLVQANGSVLLNNRTKLIGDGDQRIEATNGTLTANRDVDKVTGGNLNLAGGSGITLGGDVSTENGDLIFEDAVTANGTGCHSDQEFDADGEGKGLYAQDTITKTTPGDLTLDGGYGLDYEINLDGDVTVDGGDLILGNWWDRDDTTVAAGKTLQASDDIKVYGNLHGEGDLSLYAGVDTIQLWSNVDTVGDLLLGANTEFKGWYDQTVDAGGTLTANGYLKKVNWNWCDGWSDGSLYLHAVGDISLADYVQAATYCPECWSAGGGVSIISDTGSIFTPGADGKLNVPITGRSDHFAYTGVGLPYDAFGLAAIVIKSAKDLMLGPSAVLTARGTYYTPELIGGFWNVDDRPGVGFLDVPDNIPLGGPLRDPGNAFDAAIYVGSTNGNVDVSGPVSIMSGEPVTPDGVVIPDGGGYLVDMIIPELPEWQCVPKGAMVIDAYDTVTFDASDGVPGGGEFENSLANGQVGDRLEVCSRITEWLEDAVGRLPYALGGGPFPTGYNYVLRGAGLENPAITDGRAWVLEPRPAAAPLPLSIEVKLSGCPVLLDAVSNELGISKDVFQISIGNMLAVNPNIQPCEACAKLVNAAAVLKDADGSRMAALAQVINTIAPADMPFTPEMGTMIATAFADNAAKEGSNYAVAAEYLDAFVNYVAVLDTQMGSPTGDSAAFVMAKYGTGINENANPNIAAYVTMRLAETGR